jgi:hypothetical protein
MGNQTFFVHYQNPHAQVRRVPFTSRCEGSGQAFTSRREVQDKEAPDGEMQRRTEMSR